MLERGGRWGKVNLGQGGGNARTRWCDRRKVLGNRDVRSMFLTSLAHIIPLILCQNAMETYGFLLRAGDRL